MFKLDLSKCNANDTEISKSHSPEKSPIEAANPKKEETTIDSKSECQQDVGSEARRATASGDWLHGEDGVTATNRCSRQLLRQVPAADVANATPDVISAPPWERSHASALISYCA